MCQLHAFRYPSASPGIEIHAQEWIPDSPPRAVIQIVHGVAEHMGRYDEAARFLARHGFLVCGEDHLGHGQTARGGYGFFAAEHGWELVTQDIRHLRELEGNRHPEVPYFLLGHSMGSFLTRTYLIRWPGTLSGAILSGTGQEPSLVVALGRALSVFERLRLGPRGVSPLLDALSLGAYNSKFRPNRTSADWISRDKSMVDAYLADPHCQHKPTVTMFGDMMHGLQFIGNRANLKAMDPNTPIYFFSGDQDPVGDMGRGVRWVCRQFLQAGCRDVCIKLYPGGRHEMLHEYNRDEVLADTLAWLESKCPSAQ